MTVSLSRTVPIPMVLRDYLVEHKQRTGGRGHMFARANGKPFDAVTIGEALATYMGHASVTITYDRYGH